MFKRISILHFFSFLILRCCAQQFERLPFEELFKTEKKIEFREILVTAKGDMVITASMNFAYYYGGEFGMDFPMGGLTDLKGNPGKTPENNILADAYYLHMGFKSVTGNNDDIVYMVSDSNHLGWIDFKIGKGFGIPPFSLPNNQKIDVKKIWFEHDGDLFIAAADTIYIVEKAATLYKNATKGLNFKTQVDKAGNPVITEGIKSIKKFSLGKNIIPYCFTQNISDNSIYIGTNKGIFEFDKKLGRSFNILGNNKENQVTVSCILTSGFTTDMWFSTLEKGMGRYNMFTKKADYYPYKTYPREQSPVQNFTALSSHEFLVAAKDSLPAIFNTETYRYDFINDSAFAHSKNEVTDIKVGAAKVTFVIKGGDLYWSKEFLKNRKVQNIYPTEPYLKDLLVNGKAYRERMDFQLRNDSIKKIRLKYFDNHIDIIYAGRGVTNSDTVMFAWKLDGLWNDWQEVPIAISDDRMNMVNFDLKPGTYIFHTKMKVGNSDWLKKELLLTIIIDPPFWQTWWFWTSIIIGLIISIFFIVKIRVNIVRKQERLKAKHEKELIELEAKALRAQMNPHFIFNCLNSIKSLMQENENDKGVLYLTTFSKLIRTLFNNADKKDITLHDEIETCKLYLQLESMRFDSKFSYSINVDENIDLKSIKVPALIIQPFIENAIWHGIVPKNNGGHIDLSVQQREKETSVIIDDNGIGRKTSLKNKSNSEVMHQSKGVHLTQSRLELNNILEKKNGTLEIVDKKDESCNATGTKVILTFSQPD